ncbi:MAG: recombinase family protein [Clostridia bacterium]
MKSKKIAIYSRKSKFTGKGESIDNQIELCRQYISLHFDSNIEVLVFEDEGYSGGHLERPQFKELIKCANNKEISHIVCYRLDRISRNIGDFAKLIDDLTRLEIGFISIKEQFDTSSPMGRAMMYIASVFSQLERETIAERIRDNMHELAKTGRWLGGITPTGYSSQPVEKVTIDGKVHKSYKLSPKEDEVALVRLIFAKFIETNSITATETYLLQNNIKTKMGRVFTRFSIKNILENPVYMIADERSYDYFQTQSVELFSNIEDFDGVHGMMVYNRTIQKRGKTNETRAISDWIIAVGKHDGIINSDMWIKVQKNLEQNKSKSYRKPKSHVALLSGILRCANCGDYMRPKLSQRKNADGEFIYSYLCSTKEKSKSHNCKMKNPNGNLLDKMVCEEIKKLSEDSSEFIKSLEQGKKKLFLDKNYENELENYKESLKETDQNIKSLITSLAKAQGTPAEQHILDEIDELSEKSATLTTKISDLENLTKEHMLSDVEFDLLRDILKSFAKTFDTMSVEQKRSALKTFVKKVSWDGENVNIYVYGSEIDSKELNLNNFEPFYTDNK